MFDPLGPGTPAWNAFDDAIEAYQSAIQLPKPRSRSSHMVRYFNCRQAMINQVEIYGGNISAWKQSLDTLKKEGA